MGNPSTIDHIVSQLGSFMHYTTDSIMIIDRLGYVLAVNDACKRLYGWAEDEIVGHPMRSIPEEFQSEARQMWDVVLNGQGVTSYETTRKRKDGTLFEINLTISPLPDEHGNIEYLIGVSRDITKRKRIEETLRKREQEYRTLAQRYASLFNDSLDAVYELDLQGVIRNINFVSESITGYSVSELIGSQSRMVLPEDERDQAKEQFLRATQGEASETELRVMHKRGEVIYLVVKMLPMIENDEIIGVYGIAQDITERKRAEMRLVGHRHILEMIATGASIDDILQRLVSLVEEQSSYICSVMVKNDDDTLSCLYGPNLPAEYIGAMEGIPIGSNAGSCGTAAFRRDLVIVADIENDPLWADYQHLALTHDLRSCWSYPIVTSNGSLFGTFAMYQRRIATPGAEDIALLASYGRLISIAIEHKNRELQIQQQASTDSLTGLPNRRFFLEKLEQAIRGTFRDPQMVAVMFIDLDRFKLINDSFGHAFGDHVLSIIAKRISDCAAKEDTVARMGGDEFTMLLPNIHGTADAKRVAQSVLHVMQEPIQLDGYEFRITVSIGIAFYPGSGEDADTLMRNADRAMYSAKQEGRNLFKIHMPNMNENTYARLMLENDLRNALDSTQLFFHYQPRVNIDTGKVTSAEALIRWHHPDLGVISPAEFIPLAEETGLIIPLGDFVLRTVSAQIKQWMDAGLNPVPVAINVSAQQFGREDFVDKITTTLRDVGILSKLIEIEITETTLMKDEQISSRTLHALRDLGIRISIDDFGTGYSSLGFLKNYPIHCLKIDQSFVQDISNDVDSAAIVSAIITLGHVRRLSVVAEGVETEAQREFLRRENCDEMQGYLFSRPLDAITFEHRFLRDER